MVFFGGWGRGGGCYVSSYISVSWVKIRLHTKIQVPRLSASAFVCWGCDSCDCDVENTKSTPSLLTNDLDGV